MSNPENYNTLFYDKIADGSRRSASCVVPVVISLMPGIRSIVDLGCGNGTWLAEFRRAGIPNIYGLDHGAGVGARLVIKPEFYRSVDLATPTEVDKRDLCMSIEVAEHIPEDASDIFVDNLTRASQRILFSAAAPGQLGHDHVNEQPPGYWIEKFLRRGFKCFDVIRPIIWEDKRVCWWYRQNIMLFIHNSRQSDVASFAGLPNFNGAHLVHPDCFSKLRKERVRAAGFSKSNVVKNIDGRTAIELLGRLKVSSFWKVTRPIQFLSLAARQINSQADR